MRCIPRCATTPRFNLKLTVLLACLLIIGSGCSAGPLAEPSLTAPLITGAPVVLTTTLHITSSDNGKTFSNYRISTTKGECVSVEGASNITIEASNIGPCGEDESPHAGNGIHVKSSVGINIYDSYIHVENRTKGDCCDRHDGILVSHASSKVNIQGNVIAYNETNVEIMGRSGAISDVNVVGNYLLNPRGPFPRGQNVQSWSGSRRNSNIVVADNYTMSCGEDASDAPCSSDRAPYPYPENQQDSINFGYSENVTASGNWISGGHSAAGCGIVLDRKADDGNVLNNVLFEVGQCGIGVANGSNHLVSGNKVLSLRGPRNVGIYVWNQYQGACGPVTVTNNVVSALAKASAGCSPDSQICSYNGYWSSNCEVVESDNLFDQGEYGVGGGPAYRYLYPILKTNPPPMIPPKPKNCVANSPYSTNQTAPRCD